MNPSVSIVMPVFNSAAFVAESVASMLKQAFTDFELIIVDDASTDGSLGIIRSFRDKRIVLLRNECNRGVAASLNVGLNAARGEFIARMDADDISRPDRLAKQVAYLSSNRGVGVCGSWIYCFGAGRRYLSTYPTGSDCVRAYMLLGNPIAHPSACIRAALIKTHGLFYDENISAAQDYDFWTRCAGKMDIDNIAEPLLSYRIHGESVSKRREEVSDYFATSVVAQQLKKFAIEISTDEIAFHRRVGHGGGMKTREELLLAEKWFQKLLALNRQQSIWPHRGLEEAVGFAWFRVCQNSAGLGPWVLLRYLRSELSGVYKPIIREGTVFCVNVLRGWVLGRQPTGNLDVWTEQVSAKEK